MNGKYVKELNRPVNDQELVHRKTEELVEEKTFSKDLVEYAIDNFLEATTAYYDDFDPNKLYYKISFDGRNAKNICFDVENLAHLLGLPNYKILKEASIINSLLTTRGEITKLNARNWLTIFKGLFEDKKNDIIAYDTDIANESSKKLNWDKIAEKVFCFLNIGILSDEAKTFVYYRENVAKGKERNFVIARDIYSEGVEGQIRIQLTYEDIRFSNGRIETMLTPVSIIFVEKPGKQKIIKMQDKEYRYAGEVLELVKKVGGNYGRK